MVISSCSRDRLIDKTPRIPPATTHVCRHDDRSVFAAPRWAYVACRLVALGSLSANRPYTSFS
jgi:hypothetical protein